MFTYFKDLSLNRKAWLLLTTSCVALEGTALYFQHGMGLKPCVMCIYERLALFAILFSGIIGMIAPNNTVLRWFALLLGLYGSIKGVMLSITHTNYQLDPKPWNQCSPFVDFPETLPLNQWFPAIFEAGGDCSKISWQFLGLSMPQWLIAIFTVYSVIFILITSSQFKRTATRRDLFH